MRKTAMAPRSVGTKKKRNGVSTKAKEKSSVAVPLSLRRAPGTRAANGSRGPRAAPEAEPCPRPALPLLPCPPRLAAMDAHDEVPAAWRSWISATSAGLRGQGWGSPPSRPRPRQPRRRMRTHDAACAPARRPHPAVAPGIEVEGGGRHLGAARSCFNTGSRRSGRARRPDPAAMPCAGLTSPRSGSRAVTGSDGRTRRRGVLPCRDRATMACRRPSVAAFA
ncbi:unnamed protein product [Urochloa humidicola]